MSQFEYHLTGKKIFTSCMNCEDFVEHYETVIISKVEPSIRIVVCTCEHCFLARPEDISEVLIWRDLALLSISQQLEHLATPLDIATENLNLENGENQHG